MGWTCGTYLEYKCIQGFGYPLGTLGGPQSRSGRFRRTEKSLVPAGIQTPDCPARSQITIPSTLLHNVYIYIYIYIKMFAVPCTVLLSDFRLPPRCKWGLRFPGTFFFHGATAPSAPMPPHYRGFTIKLRHTTLGRTPLEEGSARRRDLYLTTHNTH
jgi:hypothetical protein